jgi:hypothetical protein
VFDMDYLHQNMIQYHILINAYCFCSGPYAIIN